ncbi:M48 family metallopeptidase [Hymenobacter sp. BT186]|uniref:M48 family metallopeptidase n=1 Tax=Hymenobacter telluris TaxID=2816474 RepID=A0A939F292_9BACT|nr:SprT family zinc-dependent metalloprotease [Hymenobacter telluris]MBO0360770.1 M48 family metallopeptidase [Hymenobacter telluris]MBW3376798.1 M48 family metallopeptidase [Hymenobacter norwichensis]
MPEVQIGDLHVEVVRKNIRSLRLTVYAADSRIRVAVPTRTSHADIEQFVKARRAWILKHQANFQARVRPAELQYVSGETHYYQGIQHVLQVHTLDGVPRVVCAPDRTLHLYVRPTDSVQQREKVLTTWYRAQLKQQLPTLIAQWQQVVGVQVQEWGVKQMKTRWGTCNIRAKRIWLNLDLIKRAPHCLEYVVVHELVHLHERLHNARFWGLMDQFMPEWRAYRDQLKVSLGESGGKPDAC